LIVAERRKSDLRSKTLHFTARGKLIAQQVEEINRKVMHEVFTAITQAELADATETLHLLAQGMEAFPLPDRDVLAELKRLTAALGMLSDSYADTEMPLYRYQILFELYRRKSSCGYSELVRDFPLSNSTLSRELDALATEDLVVKGGSKSDKRSVMLSLTNKGADSFAAHHQRLAEKFGSWLLGTDSKLIERGVAALNKASIQPADPSRPRIKLTISSCTDEKQVNAARSFIVEELVRQGEHHSLGNIIIPTAHTCALLSEGRKVVGVIEYSLRGPRTAVLVRIVCTPIVSPSALTDAVRELSVAISSAHGEKRTVEIYPKSIRQSVVAALS
jgi:DNA-binding MarR family transcriptional regulator